MIMIINKNTYVAANMGEKRTAHLHKVICVDADVVIFGDARIVGK
jgi:hypothetical protein